MENLGPIHTIFCKHQRWNGKPWPFIVVSISEARRKYDYFKGSNLFRHIYTCRQGEPLHLFIIRTKNQKHFCSLDLIFEYFVPKKISAAELGSSSRGRECIRTASTATTMSTRRAPGSVNATIALKGRAHESPIQSRAHKRKVLFCSALFLRSGRSLYLPSLRRSKDC